MSFFDKKQEVIDIKLTRFGRGLLARGNFKPVFYRFFDDDILYNSECANITEKQNETEVRILQAQRMKTQHLTVGVETSFDENQNQINSGSLRTFMEITRRQDPLEADSLLRYPLNNSRVNSQEAPRFLAKLSKTESMTLKDSLFVKGVETPVPQIDITARYTLTKDVISQIEERDIPQILTDSENYIDLSGEKIEFLDKSFLKLDREDIILDIEELGVNLGIDNFEFEVYEIVEEKEDQEPKLIKIDSHSELVKYFDIKTDSTVDVSSRSVAGKKKPRGRN